MIKNIDEYLLKLKKELSDCVFDIIQQALSDSEKHLREAFSRACKNHPNRAESDVLWEVIEEYGTPNEIALNYKENEAPEVAGISKVRILIGQAVTCCIIFTNDISNTSNIIVDIKLNKQDMHIMNYAIGRNSERQVNNHHALPPNITKISDVLEGNRLTEQEMRILEFLVEGKSNKQIAEELFVSDQTVKVHIRHIFEKMNVSSRTQAVAKALRQNLIQ